jgi:hypothetical protein
VSGPAIKTRVRWDPGRALTTAEQLGRETAVRGGELLLELAAGRVPYRTGRLARSARLKADERGVAIGYSRWTARVLHARAGDWHFGAGRSGRWLEETIDAHAESVGRVIAEAFKSGWPG